MNWSLMVQWGLGVAVDAHIVIFIRWRTMSFIQSKVPRMSTVDDAITKKILRNTTVRPNT